MASSTCPATTIQVPSPRAVPTTAATRPTATPLATITSRTCFWVAPIAASIPSWRSRRWATTTNPAAAIRQTSSRTTVDMPRVTAAAVTAVFSPRFPTATPPGIPLMKASICSSSASTRNEIRSACSIREGATSAKRSPRSAGFSTRPTTVHRASPSSTVSPIVTSRRSATSSVTASSPALRG